MNEIAAQLSGVEKQYPHFNLSDIDLTLPSGGVMGLIGPNGAGKSTTIRILMGLAHQDRGDVHVLGHPMPTDQVEAKREIGFASEDMRLYKQLTLGWHMDFVASIYPTWDASYADDLVRRFDLVRDQEMKRFSHGQRVKAGLLLVLARRPKLLVLDEPTTGLDPVARTEVLNELMDILADEHRSVLFSSHNTLDVERISDQITFIDRGRIIDARDKESFLERWRRLHLEAPPNLELPAASNVVDLERSGHIIVVTTNRFDPAMASSFERAGATIRAVEHMTLEEIFVAMVKSSREEGTS